jgi:hypothetical protein
MITRIYFDVDEVISPISDVPPLKAGWSDWVTVRAWGFQVRFAQDLIVELNEITARAGVQPVWLTSWEDAAATDLSPAIGLNGTDWPVLPLIQTSARGWAKLDALKADLLVQEEAGNRVDQVIWLDDHIRRYRAAANWAKTSSVPALLITPRQGVGITRAHLELVRSRLS